MAFALTQAPYSAAMAALIAAESRFTIVLSPAFTYGPGICAGTVCLGPYARIPIGTVRSFFTAWAGSCQTPNPARVGSTMAGLIWAASGGFQPNVATIQRDWDGALASVHANSFLPVIAANVSTQSAHDVRAFWRDAAFLACARFVSTNPMVQWVVVRYMDAEMEGITPNPFATWMP